MTKDWLTNHTLTSDSGFVTCWSSLQMLYLSITDFMLTTRKNNHIFNLFLKSISIIDDEKLGSSIGLSQASTVLGMRKQLNQAGPPKYMGLKINFID